MSVYAYPPDEFDSRASGPIGAHRARRSTWTRIWPFLLVAALFGGAAIAGVLLIANRHVTTETIADFLPGNDEEAEDVAEQPVIEPEPVPEAPTLAQLLANADLNAAVRVLNASQIAGEAGRGRDILADNGFAQVVAGNYAGTSTATENTVWYREGFRDTAEAVAAVFAIPAEAVVEQTPDVGDVALIIRGPLQAPAADEEAVDVPLPEEEATEE